MAFGLVNTEHTKLDDIYAKLEVLRNHLESRLDSIELRYATDVKGNPFQVTFENLDGVIVEGVWNQPMARIEF